MGYITNARAMVFSVLLNSDVCVVRWFLDRVSPTDIAAYLSLQRSSSAILTELQQVAHKTTAVTQPGGQHSTSGAGGSQLYTIETVRAMANRMKQS